MRRVPRREAEPSESRPPSTGRSVGRARAGCQRPDGVRLRREAVYNPRHSVVQPVHSVDKWLTIAVIGERCLWAACA